MVQRGGRDRPGPPLGLYLHIPFCASICSYCNFNRGLFDADLASRYVQALAREIERSSSEAAADTIFFGGGTPSILDPETIGTLISACRNAFSVDRAAEITLEANPETVTAERAARWREAGVNRISIGAQSFDQTELLRLERTHGPRRIGQAMSAARSGGFDNLSLDLMLWLPGQSRPSWARTLESALELEPSHLSLYLLELYPNAPLREAMARSAVGREGAASAEWQQAADDEAADMYLDAFDRLDAAKFRQYEISNAAHPGAESRHNLKYWTGGSWLGFGCGAHSTAGGWRWHNMAATREYVDRVNHDQPVHVDRRQVADRERAEERLFTGLRLARGINRPTFVDEFGFDPWERYAPDLAVFEERGFVWQDRDAFGLTRRGMLVSNEIAALFLD